MGTLPTTPPRAAAVYPRLPPDASGRAEPTDAVQARLPGPMPDDTAAAQPAAARTPSRCPPRALTGARAAPAGGPYAAIPGFRPLELDLYMPAGATAPVL